MELKPLAKQILDLVPQLTKYKTADLGLENAAENAPLVTLTIAGLRPEGPHKPGSGIVLAAGPSLHRQHPVDAILETGYEGAIIATDASLGYCLRNGLVPDYVLTADPHRTRIVRWFGDTHLAEREDDGYFARQDLDPALRENEIRYNEELIHLVNTHGPKIKAVVGSSAPPNVVQRCVESGMDLYWWNPMYDDYQDEEGYTRHLYRLNHAPCMVGGGNVGTAAWVFAHSVLDIRHVAVVGMDLGYAPGTSIVNTQYYEELVEMFGERAEEAFIHVHNPHLNETWYTDPTYYWYREVFLDLARDADCVTYNCTEGGILFGEGVEFLPLRQFLREHPG